MEYFLDIGKDVPKDILINHLNAVNSQGITDVNLRCRSYGVKRVLPKYKLYPGERVFLVASIAALTGTTVALFRAMEQLSKPVLYRFLKTFEKYDNIFIGDPVGYYEARLKRLDLIPPRALMAELADALDLGSNGRPCGFESH